jgi:hypothetical protein
LSVVNILLGFFVELSYLGVNKLQLLNFPLNINVLIFFVFDNQFEIMNQLLVFGYVKLKFGTMLQEIFSLI